MRLRVGVELGGDGGEGEDADHVLMIISVLKQVHVCLFGFVPA